MLSALLIWPCIPIALIIVRVSALTVSKPPHQSYYSTLSPKPEMPPPKPEVALPSELITAIETDDLDAVKRQFAKLPLSEQRDQQTLYAVAILATSSRHADILSYFFTKGLIINAESVNDPLIWEACRVSSVPIFRVLIEEGHLDPNRYIELGGDPLVMAVFAGNVELVQFLLSKGADPNNDHAWFDHIALVWSIVGENNLKSQDGGERMVRTLLEAGAKVKETGALIAAADVGNIKAMQVLLEARSKGLELDLEEVFEYGGWDSRKDEGTALWCGARSGELMAVDILLKAGADQEFRDKKGRRPIDIARANGHQDVVRRLEG